MTVDGSEHQAGDDPLIDAWFPRMGQCLICGDPGVDARHRTLDAIADRVRAGESPHDVAADYDVPAVVIAHVARVHDSEA